MLKLEIRIINGLLKVIEKSTNDFQRIQNLYKDIGKLITSSLEISEIIKAIMEQVERFFKPQNWSLYRVDPSTDELYFVVVKGLKEEDVKSFRLKVGQGIAGTVAATNQAIYIEDAKKDERFCNQVDSISGFNTKSIIAVPITFQNKVLGVIQLINKGDEQHFSTTELEVLQTIADFSAIALSNAESYEKILWAAIHDPLTGVYNREWLNQILETNYKKDHPHVKRQNKIAPLVLAIVVDVDNFKEVNDRYGHLVGDEVLVKLADILQNSCRNEDYAIRTGGDEFLLVITNLDKNDVTPTMNRFRNYFKQHNNDLLPANGISVGMAAGTLDHLDALIIEADHLMYVSKAHKLDQ